MSFEYIKLSPTEIIYGKRNLLQSQVELLQTLQRYKTYHQLRKEELLLKVALKTKVEEALSSLASLSKIIRKTKKVILYSIILVTIILIAVFSYFFRKKTYSFLSCR